MTHHVSTAGEASFEPEPASPCTCTDASDEPSNEALVVIGAVVVRTFASDVNVGARVGTGIGVEGGASDSAAAGVGSSVGILVAGVVTDRTHAQLQLPSV